MPPANPLKPSTTNNKKRKSASSASSSKPGSVKVPRKTLDSFFAPRVSVSSGNKKETNVVTLNDEQRKVLNMVVDEGKNVFFTGSAGTGKSLLLRAIIAALRKKHAGKPDAVSVTASTGMAASNIGGMTIHAWGAVAPTCSNVDTLISYIKICKPALHRWKNTQVLVIDEVSMVDGHLFDRIAAVADQLRRKTDRPFGGIQLVVTGDFFQLPPVMKGTPFFAFESNAWKKCIECIINLKQVFRQKDDKFVDLLNEMRRGTISPAALITFKSLSRPLPPSPLSVAPTELFPLRNEVTRSNLARLSALSTPLHTYTSRDSGLAGLEQRKKLLDGMMAVEELKVKEGAQVMLIKNLGEGACTNGSGSLAVGGGLVNGSVGVVLGFWRAGDVWGDFGSGDSKNTCGAIRNVKIGADAKTPLIRPKKVGDGEDKENVGPGKTVANDKGKDKPKDTTGELFPLVRFPTALGSETVLLMREEFRIEDNEGRVLARRMQIPLILAWAMSIHKSQGQTIHRVRVDLGKVFEKGQSYVALSRASSMEGLQVLRFDPKKVMAHPKVVEWSKALEEADVQMAVVEKAP